MTNSMAKERGQEKVPAGQGEGSAQGHEKSSPSANPNGAELDPPTGPEIPDSLPFAVFGELHDCCSLHPHVPHVNTGQILLLPLYNKGDHSFTYTDL